MAMSNTVICWRSRSSSYSILLERSSTNEGTTTEGIKSQRHQWSKVTLTLSSGSYTSRILWYSKWHGGSLVHQLISSHRLMTLRLVKERRPTLHESNSLGTTQLSKSMSLRKIRNTAPACLGSRDTSVTIDMISRHPTL